MKVGDKICWNLNPRFGKIDEGIVSRLKPCPDNPDLDELYVDNYHGQYDAIYVKFCHPIEHKAELRKAVRFFRRTQR